MSVKKKWAIALFVVQAIGVIGGIIGGTFEEIGIFWLIGYFLPAIIGIILLISDKNQKIINHEKLLY